MTQVASTYAQALYQLAREEGLDTPILAELEALQTAFEAEPGFVRLLSAPNLSKAEHCDILDSSFRGRLQPYVLSFLKLLTEKGYARHFSECCEAYRSIYNAAHGILPVTAVTAVPLTGEQSARLKTKLEATTGKTVTVQNRVDPAVLGGVRLDYDGRQVDGTVENRLAAIGKLLKNTVL